MLGFVHNVSAATFYEYPKNKVYFLQFTAMQYPANTSQLLLFVTKMC